jgi:Organic radical activating enzymes
MMKNNMLKVDLFEGGGKLPLVEDFYTIQGEGFNSGKPAYFIRLGGCDVGCSWCDARYTWNPKLYPPVDIDDIVARAVSLPAQAVVVTGGEPTLYPLDKLCNKLKEKNILTFIETSGAHPLTGTWDWVCLSPKIYQPPLPEVFARASELKVIINSERDFEWAEENAAKVLDTCMLYLQPEWSVYNRMIPLVVEYVKAHPRWNVSIQIHKYMHIP